MKSLPVAILDRWYRVNVEATESSSEFAITLHVEDPSGSGQWSQVYTGTVVSTGVGMLDEIFTQKFVLLLELVLMELAFRI